MCVRSYTQMCVLFYVLFCIYKGLFTPRLETRFISLLFFFFSSYMQSAYLIYFLQSFLVFLAEGYLKTTFLIQIGHRLQEKTAKTKISIPSLGHKVYRDSCLLRNEMLFHLICIKNQYGVQFILHLPFLCCKTKMSEIPL